VLVYYNKRDEQLNKPVRMAWSTLKVVE